MKINVVFSVEKIANWTKEEKLNKKRPNIPVVSPKESSPVSW